MRWTQLSGTRVAITNLGNGSATFEAPLTISGETLSFQLTVIDDDGNSASASASVDIVILDADGDELSDYWEQQYFPGDLSVLGGALADYDGDGVTDLDEFRQGMNPTVDSALDAPEGILATEAEPRCGSPGPRWPMRIVTRFT